MIMLDDTTPITIMEVERTLRARSLQPTSGSRIPRCTSLLAGSKNIGEGLGKERQYIMANGETYRDHSFLGRSTHPIKLLSGNSSNIVNGQDLQLFTFPHIGEPISNNGNAESKDISMVIRVAEKNSLLCDLLDQKLRGLSAIRAVNYLNYSFDMGLEEIEMEGVKSSPIQLIRDLPALQTVPACEVAPLSFWGGPPGKKMWYEGSLLTMLIDRIMRATDTGDIGLLGRFLNLTI